MKISCQKVMPKCIIGLFCFLLAFSALLSPAQISAAERSSYYDWGPYYNQTKVLGITFSSLEELPKIEIPENISPPPATGILPGSPFHFFETLTENVQLNFTFDPVKKEEFRLSLASERLSEAKTLVEQGNYQAAQTAATEYRNTMNTVSDNLRTLSAENNPQANILAETVEKLSADHVVIAQSASLSSPSVATTTWNQLLTASENAMDSAAETRGQPAIPEELSISLQELKNTGLLTPEQSDKLYSLASRSQVRAEIDKLTAAGTFPQAEAAKLDTAVAVNYPDIYNQTLSVAKFVELRSYQTLPPPSEEILKSIEEWREQKGDLPPPAEIKPYLYHARASELAQNIDFAPFSTDLQTEVAKFYPDAVSENPTYTPPPPLPSPTPEPSPTPTEQTTQETASPQEPIPTPSTESPYLAQYNGPLPGTTAYYLFKQIGEGAGLFTAAFNPARRMELSMLYAEERLKEARALSQTQGKEKDFQNTLERYKDSLDDITQNLKNYQGNEETRRGLAEKFEADAARHNVIFEKGLIAPTPENAEVVVSAIAATQNVMDTSADALEKPAIPPSLETRLQDLKAQGQLLPEEVDKIVQSQSREEVREKIRELVKLETFPLADAKKLDEAQLLIAPSDYNQLVEVRKIEELQNLRSVQTDLAQTPTLKSQVSQLDQRASQLGSFFDPSLIKPEDLGGRENLVKTYEKLASIPRPINGGQFGAEATPGAQPVVTKPSSRDAVLTTCPQGATFKQFEGCVWADTGRGLNDYDQYKCDGSRQYYSFAAKKCLAYKPGTGFKEDAQPICPVGYQWSWQTQSCQTSTGGILPYPSPAEPKPQDVEDVGELSKRCPEGSSFLPPSGCFWDDGGGPVYDPEQYRCSEGQYYSFEEHKCVPIPKPGVPYPKNTTPTCKAEGLYWNWSVGQCLPLSPEPSKEPLGGPVIIDDIKPTFVTPGNPFYFLKQAAERVQYITAFTPQARERVTLAQAEERLAEAVDALKKDDQQGARKAINAYTSMMQDIVADVSKESLTQGAKAQIAKRLKEESAEHNLLLEKLQALAPEDLDTPLSAAVSATILGVDKAADIAGEPPIPDEVKAKIEALPEDMISEEDKKKLLEMGSRVEARLNLGGLINNGALTQTEVDFLNEDFAAVDQNARIKVEELKKLEQIAEATTGKNELQDKIEKNEELAQKLQDFEKTFEVGQEIPAEIRPYVRLTRINEITQTIRPDIVRIEDFGNRRDVQLAVATLKEEFKPTRETVEKLEQYRRNNPGRPLPFDLARAEALTRGLGVRNEAEPCYLPPPFAPNTPCPPPGAAIPIASYVNYVVDLADRDFPVYRPGYRGGPNTGYGNVGAPSLDKDGKPLVYGQGPKPESSGVCTDGYHWMYDSGGWCMSNAGSYSSSYNYTPTGPQTAGYTPYSPYYTAPGAPPTTYGYTNDPNFINLYNPLPGGPYTYTPPTYYGTAPTYYTTNPPAGTVPGSGPQPTSPGQCPTGYHWMSDSGGWCMADGPTYVPSGQTSNYYSPNLNQSSCGPGYYWDGRGCIRTSPTDSPSSYQSGCTPGYYWDGNKCVAGSYSGSGWSDTAARSQSWCQPPSSGCGTSAYWDYGSCSCRGSYSTGSGSASSCSGATAFCESGYYWDSGSCGCRSNTDTSTSTSTYTAPSSSGSTSSGSCPSGYHWMSDSGGWCMSDGAAGSSTGSSGGSSSSSGSCPSGSHWMSDNGGYCMSDSSTQTQTQTDTQTQTQTDTQTQTQTDTQTQTQTQPTTAP